MPYQSSNLYFYKMGVKQEKPASFESKQIYTKLPIKTNLLTKLKRLNYQLTNLVLKYIEINIYSYWATFFFLPFQNQGSFCKNFKVNGSDYH